MDYKERSQLLKDKGISIDMISQALDVTPQAIYQTLRDGRSSKRIASAISALCNEKLVDMFPYYLEEKKKKKLQEEINRKLAKFA